MICYRLSLSVSGKCCRIFVHKLSFVPQNVCGYVSVIDQAPGLKTLDTTFSHITLYLLVHVFSSFDVTFFLLILGKLPIYRDCFFYAQVSSIKPSSLVNNGCELSVHEFA